MNKNVDRNKKSIRYHAFISYRHVDNEEQGRQWATWLHQAIETYEVPSDLVGKTDGRGGKIPARIYPVFRDEEELPANSDLGNSIVDALDSSQILVVLCSPRAVASTYVANEIDYFKAKCNGSDRIIAAMIDGEPNASWDKGKLSSGFNIEDECFPVPLQFEYDKNGNRTERRAEPIAADFRVSNHFRVSHKAVPEQGWTSPEAYRQHLKLSENITKNKIEKLVAEYQTQQHLMFLKIIAGILGVPLGDLTQRDKQHQLEQARLKAKKLRRWLTAVGFFALLAVGAGFIAYVNQQEAIKQTKEAQISQSKTIAQNAVVAFNRGEYQKSISLALSVLPESFSKPNRAFSADAEAILSSAAFYDRLIYSDIGDPSWSDSDWLRKEPYKSFITEDKSRLIIYGGASPVIINLLNNTRLELETLPEANYWSTWVSKTGRFIAGETENENMKMTYLWSTIDGRLLSKQPARFYQFSGNEQFAGFYNKDSKTKTTKGYLLNIVNNKNMTNFEGKFKDVDEDNNLIFVQKDKNCYYNDEVERVCESTTSILSLDTGEPLLSMQGELIDGSLNGDVIMLKNSIDIDAKISSNKLSGRKNKQPKGVAKWNTTAMQQVAFYPGHFEYYNSQFDRLITSHSHLNKSKLWDLLDNKLVSDIEGDIISLDGDKHKKEFNNTLLYDWDDKPNFLTSTSTEFYNEVLKYSLLDGAFISRTKGNYLGQLDSGRIITQSYSQGLYDIYAEDSMGSLVDMPHGFCSEDVYQDSSHPIMSDIAGSAIIFNCREFIALYYPNSSNPNKPQIILSNQPANWVEGGNLFWFGKDNAELMSFSYWEGGGVYAEKILKLPVTESITFRSLLDGEYLLALTPDSKISLWDSSGSIFEPIVTVDEFELSEDYLKSLEGKVSSDQKLKIEQKLNLISEIGFDHKNIHSVENIPFEERRDVRWSKINQIQQDSVFKQTQYKVDSFVELKSKNLSVIFGELDAYLVNTKSGELVSQLYAGKEYSDSFFSYFSEPSGVSESPDGKSFIFYNYYGVWLFDMRGNLLSTLCNDEATCSGGVDFSWIGDGSRVFIVGKDPHIFSFDEKQKTDMCKSYLKKHECRTALSGSIIFGKNTIATGSAIFDLSTGIRLLELSGALGGMFAHPFRFNEDESAVLMVAETGGGTSLYGIWRLPERGETLLSKMRARVKSLD